MITPGRLAADGLHQAAGFSRPLGALCLPRDRSVRFPNRAAFVAGSFQRSFATPVQQFQPKKLVPAQGIDLDRAFVRFWWDSADLGGAPHWPLLELRKSLCHRRRNGSRQDSFLEIEQCSNMPRANWRRTAAHASRASEGHRALPSDAYEMAFSRRCLAAANAAHLGSRRHGGQRGRAVSLRTTMFFGSLLSCQIHHRVVQLRLMAINADDQVSR